MNELVDPQQALGELARAGMEVLREAFPGCETARPAPNQPDLGRRASMRNGQQDQEKQEAGDADAALDDVHEARDALQHGDLFERSLVETGEDLLGFGGRHANRDSTSGT